MSELIIDKITTRDGSNVGAVVVSDIDELLLLNTNKEINTTAIVKDSNRGGVFIYEGAQSGVNNGGTIFNGWVRQYDGAVNVKWFGADGTYTNDTLSLSRASLIGKDIITENDMHINSSILLPSDITFSSLSSATINIDGASGYSSDNVFSIAETSNVTIKNLNFVGSGRQTGNPITVFSCSDAERPKFINCSFENIHGAGFRLNRSNRGYFSNIHFEDITGENGAPGEGFYSQGITNAYFENISCNNIGDHLFYIQGDDTSIVNNLVLDKIRPANTGLEGLTGGASIVFYNRCDNIVVNDYIGTEGIPTGIYINTKDNFTTQASSNIIISNMICTNPTNRGVQVLVNTPLNPPSVGFKDFTFSNITTGNTGNGFEINYVDGLEMTNCKSVECYSNLFLNSVSNFSITGGNYSKSRAGRGIQLEGACIYGKISGVIANRCYREGVLISGNSDYIYLDNPILLPVNHPTEGGVNDSFRDISTGTHNSLQNVVPRDQGLRVTSNVFGVQAPPEGSWNRGDKVTLTSPSAGGVEGWVCIASGTPGTWKTFGTIQS